jgi:hypothetical protein
MFSLGFDRQNRLALARFSGEFGRDDIAALDHAIESLVAAEGRTHLLFDFSTVESVAMPDRAIAERGRRPPMCPGYQRVIVAPQLEIFELYRLFGANQSLIGSDAPTIVKTMEFALIHLGVRKPHFKSIQLPARFQLIRMRR